MSSSSKEHRMPARVGGKANASPAKSIKLVHSKESDPGPQILTPILVDQVAVPTPLATGPIESYFTGLDTTDPEDFSFDIARGLEDGPSVYPADVQAYLYLVGADHPSADATWNDKQVAMIKALERLSAAFASGHGMFVKSRPSPAAMLKFPLYPYMHGCGAEMLIRAELSTKLPAPPGPEVSHLEADAAAMILGNIRIALPPGLAINAAHQDWLGLIASLYSHPGHPACLSSISYQGKGVGLSNTGLHREIYLNMFERFLPTIESNEPDWDLDFDDEQHFDCRM